MKQRNILFVLAALWLGGATLAPTAAAQADTAASAVQTRRGPVEKLLRYREALGLSDAQVEALRQINLRMEERNQPLVRRLVEIRREAHAQLGARRPSSEMTPEQKEVARRHLEAARPLLQEIRKNNHRAMREVGEVLTVEQRTRLREMLPKKRDHRRGSDGRHRDRAR